MDTAPITATEKIRRISVLPRQLNECGWKVKITRLAWWREANPGSSTVAGRVRKEGQKRGRKKAIFY